MFAELSHVKLLLFKYLKILVSLTQKFLSLSMTKKGSRDIIKLKIAAFV